MHELKGARLKTFGENILSVGKAAVLPTAALLGLNYLGIHTNFDEVKANLSKMGELALQVGPFTAGLATGVAQNTILIGATLASLNGKTDGGDYEPKRTESDGTLVYELHCIDNRIHGKSAAIAGSFAPMGSALVNLAEAFAAMHTAPNTAVGEFAAGYFVGSNILTEAFSHASLLWEVFNIIGNSHGHRAKIEMIDHWKGCGAEGFTNPLSYLLKFKAHALTLADIVALPNEVAGYIYVNGILAPLVGVSTGGKVSLSAVAIKHSTMSGHNDHHSDDDGGGRSHDNGSGNDAAEATEGKEEAIDYTFMD